VQSVVAGPGALRALTGHEQIEAPRGPTAT